MTDLGHDLYYYENTEGGHAAGEMGEYLTRPATRRSITKHGQSRRRLWQYPKVFFVDLHRERDDRVHPGHARKMVKPA